MGVDTPICIGILMSLMAMTRGQRALSRAFEQRILTQAEVVEAVGAAQSSVSTWASGKSLPDPVQREALRRCFGIPTAWWLTAEQRRRLGRLRLRRSLVPIAHAARMRADSGPRKVNAGTGDYKDRSKCAAGSSR